MKSPNTLSNPYIRKVALGLSLAAGSLTLGACVGSPDKPTPVTQEATLESMDTDLGASVNAAKERPDLSETAFERLKQGQSLNFYNGIVEINVPGRTIQNINYPFLIATKEGEAEVTAQDIQNGEFAIGYYERSSKPGVGVFEFDPNIMQLAETEPVIVGKGQVTSDILPVVFADLGVQGYNIYAPQYPATGLVFSRPQDGIAIDVGLLYTVQK